MQRERTKTLQEIAEITGLSKATVSRVLSGSHSVSPQTKKRVLDVTYDPDEPKTDVNKSLLGTIALVIPGAENPLAGRLNHPFYLELSTAIISELGKVGYACVIEHLQLWSEQSIRRFFSQYDYSGCIMIGQPFESDFNNIELFKQQAKHLVSWGANASDLGLITVGSENTYSARDAVSHLIKNGRKHILFMGNRSYRETRQRYEGYVMAHADNSMDYDERLVIEAPSFDIQRASHMLLNVITKYNHVDAVFATNDLLIMKAITTLSDLGLSVPKDIAMIGFDDIKLASLFNPPITTVKQNIELGARLLTEKIVRSINGQSIQSELISSELIVRQSCGALK